MAQNVNIDFNSFNSFDVFTKPTSNVIYNQKSLLNSEYLQNRLTTFLTNIFSNNNVNFDEGVYLLIECVKQNFNPYVILSNVLNSVTNDMSITIKTKHIQDNKLNISGFFEVYMSYVKNIKYCRKLFNNIIECTNKKQYLIYIMTNFYLYYNLFEKENIQQLMFTSFNKDNF